MKYAIMSDLHANPFMLRMALLDARTERAVPVCGTCARGENMGTCTRRTNQGDLHPADERALSRVRLYAKGRLPLHRQRRLDRSPPRRICRLRPVGFRHQPPVVPPAKNRLTTPGGSQLVATAFPHLPTPGGSQLVATASPHIPHREGRAPARPQ